MRPRALQELELHLLDAEAEEKTREGRRRTFQELALHVLVVDAEKTREDVLTQEGVFSSHLITSRVRRRMRLSWYMCLVRSIFSCRRSEKGMNIGILHHGNPRD